jgi:uncharacterized protein DUF4252
MHARRGFCAAALLALPLLAFAGSGQIGLPALPGLRAQATERVDINLGRWALHFVSWLIDDRDRDGAAVRRIIRGLTSVRILSYEFTSDIECPTADLAALRSQLSSPPWTQVVHTQDLARREDVDIYVAAEERRIEGTAIIACEPRELTILNIVGPLDLDQVAALRKTFRPHHGPGE